jgi:hypothetical protein
MKWMLSQSWKGQKRKLDYEYLAKRAKAADVMELLQALTGRIA